MGLWQVCLGVKLVLISIKQDCLIVGFVYLMYTDTCTIWKNSTFVSELLILFHIRYCTRYKLKQENVKNTKGEKNNKSKKVTGKQKQKLVVDYMEKESDLTKMAEATVVETQNPETDLTTVSRLNNFEKKLDEILKAIKPLGDIDRNLKELTGKFELLENKVERNEVRLNEVIKSVEFNETCFGILYQAM